MKANWRRLSIRSLGAAIKRVINVTNFNANDEAKNHTLFVTMVTVYNVFAPLIPKSVWSGMSDSVRKLATEVYAYLKGIRKIAEGAAQFPNTDRGRAGMEVVKIIKKGGKIYNQKVGEADFSTTSVINELNKPENAAHITALGVSDELQKLTAAKAQHDALDTQRVDAESELRQTDSASNARTEMEAALKNWLNLVTAMRNVDGWQDLYHDLNEVVKAAKRAIREGKELTEEGEVAAE